MSRSLRETSGLAHAGEPWWEVASAIAETGHDCTVLDPGATEDRDWSRGDAVISVRQHTGLGWTIVVSEAEAEAETERKDPPEPPPKRYRITKITHSVRPPVVIDLEEP